MWRVLRYQTNLSPLPLVRLIKSMMSDVSDNFRRQKQLSDMDVYFARPPESHG